MKPDSFDVEQPQIDTMLRHLWMFQLEIGDEVELDEEDEGELVAVSSANDARWDGRERRVANAPFNGTDRRRPAANF